MMYRSSVYAVIFVFIWLPISDAEIKWALKTKPVILGKNATLTCNGTNCPPKNSKRWLGGNKYELLCFDNVSKKSSKFVMITNGTSFDLIIKNFSLSDANCEYTCTCGFLQYTDMLTLHDCNVIYPSKMYTKMFTETDGRVLIDITIKVYPLPTCEITYQGRSSQVNITFSDIHEGHSGSHLLRLHHIFDMEPENCNGNLNLTCKICSNNYIVTEERLDFCKYHHKNMNYSHGDYLIIGSLVGCVILVIIVLIVVLFWKFVKKKPKRNQKDDMKYKSGKYTIEKNKPGIGFVFNQNEIDVSDRESMVPEVGESEC